MPQLEDYNIFGSPYKQLDRKFNTWCRWTQRLDTYGRGCLHGCEYCYAKALLNFRGNWLKHPAVANIKEIRNKIESLKRGELVRLGGMTDCFQPIEQELEITYKTIQWLNKYRIPYLIVTKSDLIATSKYINIYDPVLAHFQVSLSSTNDVSYERAVSVVKRINTIEILYKLGFDISIRLSPLLPEYVNYSILNSINCNKILIEFLKVNHWIKKNFKYNYSNHSLNYGGHQNLQLENKIELLKGIDNFEQISIGEFVPEHYIYFRDNVNYNKADCCNLTFKNDYKELQLKLFNEN